MKQDAQPPQADPLPARVIGSWIGEEPGPTLLCTGALHGNEPAGMLALRRVFAQLEQRRPRLRGEFTGLVGNRTALAARRRYVDSDLNRHWHAERIDASRAGTLADSLRVEDRELDQLRGEAERIFARARGDVFLLDLHTTSGHGSAFGTMSDTLRNRDFALHLPVPIIVGLEEELGGTLTDFVGGLGHVSIGFEGGQHDDPVSVDRAEAAIWIALVATGVLDVEAVPELAEARQRLMQAAAGLPRICEVRYRHAITPEDEFKMELGFTNFQPIRAGQLLARDRTGAVLAHESGRILMPLYQQLGEDGYFEIREFRPVWLGVSRVLRRLRADRWVHLLPGVSRHPELPDGLIVNRRVARWFALQIFHLLGYRRHRLDGERLVVSRRQYDFPTPHS